MKGKKNMKKQYKIDKLDFNQINFIEQSLKKHIEYYQDLNIKRPGNDLYINALKTVKDLYIKINSIRISKNEKPQIRVILPELKGGK
jgi:transposase